MIIYTAEVRISSCERLMIAGLSEREIKAEAMKLKEKYPRKTIKKAKLFR